MMLKKLFLKHCEDHHYEINQNQLEIIDDLKDYYSDNFSQNLLRKIFKKKDLKLGFYLVGDVDLNNPSAVSKNLISLSHKKKILRHFKYRKNISEFIKKSTIIVLPSYREGFPKILMEAAACGRPIITTNVPGCKDAIVNNKTGILIPSKNYKALANAINKLSQDRNKIEKFSFEARNYAVDNFNIKDVISKHFSIYKEIER